MKNNMVSFYEKLINKPEVVYPFSGILILVGIVATALSAKQFGTYDLLALLFSGNLLYCLFVTMLIVLVIVGGRIDNRPGKSIALAIVILAIGSIVRLVLPFAQSNDWQGEWNGVMLGIILVTFYLSFRIGARFSVMAMVCALYAMIVTGGITFGFVGPISVTSIYWLMAIGVLAVVMAFLSYSHVRANMEVERRKPVSQSVRVGMARAMTPMFLAGLAVFLIAAPLAVFSDGPQGNYSLLIMIGGPVSAIAVLITAVPLVSMTLNVQVETGAQVRRGGRRQR